MKFRYFKLRGPSLEAYLESEREEMEQRTKRNTTLLDKPEVKSFRPGHYGGVMSITFNEGMRPEGFIQASRRLPKTSLR